MPYRDPLFSLRVPAHVADLHGPSPAGGSPLLALAVGAVVSIASAHGTGSLQAGLGVGFAAIFLFFRLDRGTRRFRLAMCAEHVRLQSLVFGFLPLPARRIPLAWSVGRDEDAYGFPHGGVVFATPPWMGGADMITFGPVDDAEADALVVEISARLNEARRVLSASDTERELRPSSGDLHSIFGALDPASIVRNSWGRVVRAVLRADAELEGIRLGRGSTVHLSRTDVWLPPGAPDRIVRAELASRTRVAALGRTVQAGATLLWDERRMLVRILRGFDGEVDVGGLRVDGREDITFDTRGRLASFTTAAPMRFETLDLPSGTHIAARAWALVLSLPDGEGSRATLVFPRTWSGRRADLQTLLRNPRRYLEPRGTRRGKDQQPTPTRLWRA
ncbi:Hypothetical protein A7982_08154 [Minicystis rosea]|nr:Hypothetical protein A7982_08154 [Minicystis rosea]